MLQYDYEDMYIHDHDETAVFFLEFSHEGLLNFFTGEIELCTWYKLPVTLYFTICFWNFFLFEQMFCMLH